MAEMIEASRAVLVKGLKQMTERLGAIKQVKEGLEAIKINTNKIVGHDEEITGHKTSMVKLQAADAIKIAEILRLQAADVNNTALLKLHTDQLAAQTNQLAAQTKRIS